MEYFGRDILSWNQINHIIPFQLFEKINPRRNLMV